MADRIRSLTAPRVTDGDGCVTAAVHGVSVVLYAEHTDASALDRVDVREHPDRHVNVVVAVGANLMLVVADTDGVPVGDLPMVAAFECGDIHGSTQRITVRLGRTDAGGLLVYRGWSQLRGDVRGGFAR
ncbi:MAG: hypothetical protein JNK78_19220, partial [Planctomycetes bacterium]|nr:hypothetical protein [Planctomycetota bacterium]